MKIRARLGLAPRLSSGRAQPRREAIQSRRASFSTSSQQQPERTISTRTSRRISLSTLPLTQTFDCPDEVMLLSDSLEVYEFILCSKLFSNTLSRMVRPKQPPDRVASRIVTVRLTPPEYDALLSLVDAGNQKMASSGLSPTVTPASYMVACFLRTVAAESGLNKLDGNPSSGEPTSIKQSNKTKPRPAVPTRYERILRAFEATSVPQGKAKKTP